MGNVWGDKKTVKQIIREQKRINNRSIRELDRELNRIKREQKKAQNEMKRLAKQGQMQAVKHLAKDIVRMKDSETKFIKLKAELRSLSAQMDNMAATAQLQKAMKNVSRTLGTLSNQIKLPELQVMHRFIYTFHALHILYSISLTLTICDFAYEYVTHCVLNIQYLGSITKISN